MRNPLGPSIDASARVVFEALAAIVAVSSRSDRRAVFPRYAGYYAWLSRLPRRLQRSCSRERRSLKLSTWRDGLLVMLLVLATPLAYAQLPSPPGGPPPVPPVPVLPFCGDGIVNSDNEQCDDGNTTRRRRLLVDLQVEPVLRRRRRQSAGEQCDDGNTVGRRRLLVHLQVEPCLRRRRRQPGGEQCDDGNTTSTATAARPPASRAPVCGDGIVNPAGEQCDDGNTADGDGCSSTCTARAPICGDGVVNPAPSSATTATPSTATAARHLHVEPVSAATASSTPAASSATTATPSTATAARPPASRARLRRRRRQLGGEQCDDGNNVDGDGCSSTCQIEPRADLALSLADTPDPLTVNGQLTYTITVRNNGPGTATGVEVVDPLPPEATVLSASSSQGLCNGTETVVCNLGTLAAGAHNQATVTINVIPTVTGLLSNAAHVTAAETDLDLSNNNRTETTTVKEPEPVLADLAVTAAAILTPGASSRQQLTYTLTVRNDGSATATGVQLTNNLPPGVGLRQITPSQTCRPTDPVLCDLGTLLSGETATVMIDVIRPEGSTLPNRAAINGEQHDPNTANNFALTSALDLPTPQTACNSKRCSLRLRCNLSDLLGRTCDNQITLFVDTRARQQSNQRAARGPGWFASLPQSGISRGVKRRMCGSNSRRRPFPRPSA